MPAIPLTSIDYFPPRSNPFGQGFRDRLNVMARALHSWKSIEAAVRAKLLETPKRSSSTAVFDALLGGPAEPIPGSFWRWDYPWTEAIFDDGAGIWVVKPGGRSSSTEGLARNGVENANTASFVGPGADLAQEPLASSGFRPRPISPGVRVDMRMVVTVSGAPQAGFSLSNVIDGTCEPGRRNPFPVKCPPGTTLIGNECVANPVKCPPGTTLVGNECVPDKIVCPPGTTLIGNQCVPDPLECPPGFTKVNGECVENDPEERQCLPGCFPALPGDPLAGTGGCNPPDPGAGFAGCKPPSPAPDGIDPHVPGDLGDTDTTTHPPCIPPLPGGGCPPHYVFDPESGLCCTPTFGFPATSPFPTWQQRRASMLNG